VGVGGGCMVFGCWFFFVCGFVWVGGVVCFVVFLVVFWLYKSVGLHFLGNLFWVWLFWGDFGVGYFFIFFIVGGIVGMVEY